MTLSYKKWKKLVIEQNPMKAGNEAKLQKYLGMGVIIMRLW